MFDSLDTKWGRLLVTPAGESWKLHSVFLHHRERQQEEEEEKDKEEEEQEEEEKEQEQEQE